METSAALRQGRPARLGFVADRTSQAALSARIAVSGIVDSVGTPVAAAQLVTANEGGDFDANLALAMSAAGGDGPAVHVRDVGDARSGDLSRFSLTAPQNLVLFVFINAMASAVLIVVARREGILRRALATRTSVGVILAGLGLGWLALALAQSAIGRNEDRVGAFTPVIGIVLGALGGCMVPLEVFPPAMEAVAHAVPHFWAVRAWQQLVFDGEGLAAILQPLAALAAFAAVFLALATSLLRRQLTR